MKMMCLEFILVFSVFGCCSSQNTIASNVSPKSYMDMFNDIPLYLQYSHNARIQNTSKILVQFVNEIFSPLNMHLRNNKLDTRDDIIHSRNQIQKMIDVLRNLEERKNSSICLRDLRILGGHLLDKRKEAIQFLDATGKPGAGLTKYHLSFIGEYFQCRSAFIPEDVINKTSGFRGNYCDVYASSAGFSLLDLGACIPDSCSSHEFLEIIQEILKALRVQLPSFIGLSSECKTASTKLTTATYFAITVVTVLGTLMILGTGYDVYLMIEENRNIKDNYKMTTAVSDCDSKDNDADGNVNGIDGNVCGVDRYDDEIITDRNVSSGNQDAPLLFKSKPVEREQSSILCKSFLAFSVYTNGKKLLNTTQVSGSLGAIHGIRFLSMSWVVLCHASLYIISFTKNRFELIETYSQRWTFLPISNGFSSVDTFFTLSGLLTSYLTVQEIKKRNTWKINWPMFYFHRFWRLTPPYMLVIIFFLGLTQYFGEGPLWSNIQPQDKNSCENYWWTNLFYINNLVHNDQVCLGQSWYLANDMQFFVLSPVMLIPFHFHRFAGLATCLILLIISWFVTGILSTIKKWPPTIVMAQPDPEFVGKATWMQDYYIKPWCRIGPFIVGIIAGYILAQTKGRQFKIHWMVVVIGWIIAFATGLSIVYGLRGDITGENESTIATAAFYNTVSRTFWGACICWVIIACSAGYGGPINSLLSWSPFVVLGRLTYMAYLIHMNLGKVMFQNLEAMLYINDTTFAVLYLGFIAFVNMVSFVGVLVFESPMIGLEKVFLRKQRA